MESGHNNSLKYMGAGGRNERTPGRRLRARNDRPYLIMWAADSKSSYGVRVLIK